MPKRKRDYNPVKDRKAEVEAKITHGTKLLHRALKTANRFEWQKIVKRIKLAGEADGDGARERKRKKDELEVELEALKNFDLANLAASHLYKRLLRSKTLVKEGVLPEYVTNAAGASGGVDGQEPEEGRLARANVAARLFNTKPVKETMASLMEGIYGVAGLKREDAGAGAKGKDIRQKPEDEFDHKSPEEPLAAQVDRHLNGEEADGNEPEWNGFESKSGSEPKSEDLSCYEGLIAVSSGGESKYDDSADEIQRPSTSKTIKSKSLSVSVSASSESESPPPPPTKAKKLPPQPAKGSTFLPTLMNGYWSGSEEPATDDEAPAPQKNRPGQQARRAKWERKYGVKANHLKGQAKTRDIDWDPKRGARASDERVSRSGRGGKVGFSRGREQVTGENAVALQPRRGRGLGQRDDAGELHPSWVAAKKAKEMTKPSVAFQGKKVVFE